MNCVNSGRFPADKGAFSALDPPSEHRDMKRIFGSSVYWSDRAGPLFTTNRAAGGFYLLTSPRRSVTPFFFCLRQGQRASRLQKATCAIKELSSRFLFESKLRKSSYLSGACDSLPALRATSKATIIYFFLSWPTPAFFRSQESVHPSIQ